MNEQTHDVVVRLANAAAVSAISRDQRAAAALTGALPVYEDRGGMLLIAPDLNVLYFDPDTGETGEVTEEFWRVVARVSAARKFAELRHLRPEMPPNGSPCDRCGGSGEVFPRVGCGACAGTGWLQDRLGGPK
jgi:hypothetical protein